MKTVEKIQAILKEKMITPAHMLRDLGFSSGLFSQWKSGKQNISQAKLEKIAEYLEVTPFHLRYDELRERAIEKFGFCWEYREREQIEADARSKREGNSNLSDEEIIETYINEFKALFSRSLENYEFDLSHVDFKTYVAMLLNQEDWKKKCTQSGVYKKMVERFGTKQGIPYGSYYPFERYHDDDTAKKPDFNSSDILDSSKIRHIPVFKSISAGFGTYASSDIVSYIPLFIESDYEAAETLCIKVKGNSMYPKIEDGDIIVVHKQDEVDSGSIAALMVGDEGFVKKFIYDNEHAVFVSINPEYPDKEFVGKEMLQIKVVGLVKRIIKEL